MSSLTNKPTDRMDEILRHRGFKPAGVRRERVLYKKGPVCYAVETRSVPLYRAGDFRALIGDAILRFRASGGAERLLLAVRFGRMGHKAESDLCEYAAKHLPDLCWLLVPDRGDARLHLAPHGDETIPCDAQSDAGAACVRPAGSSRLFSPKSQWLWKLLLMPGVDESRWGGGPVRPRSVSELAARSGVSQPAVSAFVGRAEAAGFLSRGAGRLTVVNHRELLDDWVYAAKHMRRQVIGVRPLYKEATDEGLLKRIREYCKRYSAPSDFPPVVVGSHLACHLLGLGRSNQRSARLHLAGRPVAEVMEALDLVPDAENAAALALVTDSLADSIHRGCVSVDGVPVADALQCYLDVRPSHARGYEQAEFIYERVLRPQFERN